MFAAALAAGALSVDALKGSVKPFDPRISALRGQPGQIRVAAAIAALLDGSEILASHGRCGKVQDPYSFRCQPQVMGAALDLLTNAARTLTIEAGAVTDNPIVFPDEDTAISGGNFHAQPVAFAADTIAMALVRGRLDLRAPHRGPGRPQDERPAAVPGRGLRASIRG